MTKRDTKQLILSRRAKFVAAAMASAGLALGACDESTAEPCLSIAAGGNSTTSGTGGEGGDGGDVGGEGGAGGAAGQGGQVDSGGGTGGTGG